VLAKKPFSYNPAGVMHAGGPGLAAASAAPQPDELLTSSMQPNINNNTLMSYRPCVDHHHHHAWMSE
jgi:hypothetical protein